MALENFILHILIVAGIYSILAISLNLAMGYADLRNFGQAAFYAIGAYASAIAVMHLKIPFLLAIIMAGLITALFGILIGLLSLRFRGDYLALATLGFAIIMEVFLKNTQTLIRGTYGISGIPKPQILSTSLNYFIFVLVVIVITYTLCKLIVNSPFGRLIKATRDDELAASTLGKNIYKNKIQVLAISAFFAGIAGSLFAHYITYINPDSFTILESALIVSMIVIGGLASLEGSIIGAIILILLPEPLRFLNLSSYSIGAIRQILYSLVLIYIVIKKPEGLLGEKYLE